MLKPSKLAMPILLLGLGILSTTLTVSFGAQDAKRVVFDKGAFFGTSTPLPKWDNGYLISWEVETFQASTRNVRLYDSSGNQVRAASIWFPDAARVLVYSATATPDGRIIAGGSAKKQDGTAAGFIVRTDLGGEITDVIHTKGFGPLNVCEAPDGTVWSFGGTGFEGRSSQPKPGDTLRHFDFDKGEMASYLARSSFPKTEIQAGIRCSADEVIAYSPNAKAYIEMKYGGDAPQVFRADPPPGLRFTGFAVTGPRKIYAHFSKGGNSGLFQLSFNDASKTAEWLPVTGTAGAYTTPGVIVGLWGADGDQLIVSRGEDPTGTTALHWISPLDR